MKWHRLYKESSGGLMTKDEFDELFYDYVDVASEYYCQEGCKSKNAKVLKLKMEEFIDTVKSNVSRDYKYDDPEWEERVNMVIHELDDIIVDGNDDWIEGKKRQLWYDFISYKSLPETNTNEASEEPVDIKKLLKLNGISKLPSGTVFRTNKVHWEKSGGYAGDKILSKVKAQLRDAGWQRVSGSNGSSADGSLAGSDSRYVSPDRRIEVTYYSYYGATSRDNSYGFTFQLADSPVNESTIRGTGRVDFDDDLVAVYTPDGKLEYKGILDDCPYKDDDMRYDRTTMTYRIEGPNGDYRTMAKLAESCRESSRFGFNVGDEVELKSDVEPNRFSGRGVVPAGTVGEVVSIDKPMPGVIKVKIEDGTVVSVAERKLKFAGTDNEPWEKYKVPAKPRPSLKEILDKHGPEEIYMEPPPADGSPKWTGD